MYFLGESNIYTLGNIGDHVVVSTKLSAVGSSRSAMISAGSITTRLLGTFPGVEHVFIVGAGGGVPDLSDNKRGVRLGDVVISAPSPNRGKDLHRSRETNEVEGFTVNSWIPDESAIESIYVAEGIKVLSEAGVCERFSFDRPPIETDIVTSKTKSQMEKNSLPLLHLGPIGAGRLVARVSMLRNEFARRYGVICFDAEFDAVVQSIFGNRIGSWALIRGIADYVDGTKSKQWQPYAAMQSAAVLKTLLLNMPPQK
ncbi:unnamed protein product [Soboliphyme baturini]|uniref:PNP_UDP_1 domain-containing protein n=1 Tax=Soboliphyme baturini TaxID=241478 RepID=A0A183J9N4_9BILA|nr:unnamed protein product [Soboliphyme baturini]